MRKTQELRVFISSKDALEDERSTVEAVLHEIGVMPLRAETKTHLATNRSDEYLRQVSESALVILILELADEGELRDDDYYRYVKAEVDLAFTEGKTVLTFVKAASRSSVVDEFLESIQQDLFYQQFKNCTELREVVRKSVLEELFRSYTRKPKILTSKRETYEYGARLVEQNCRMRLFLCQSTPVLLLGARKGKRYEQKLYDAVYALLERSATDDQSVEVAVLFDPSTTDAELRDNAADYDLTAMRRNVERLRTSNAGRLYVGASTEELVPFVVVDHTYAIGHALRNRILAVVDTNPAVADELNRMVLDLTSQDETHGLAVFEELLASHGL